MQFFLPFRLYVLSFPLSGRLTNNLKVPGQFAWDVNGHVKNEREQGDRITNV